MLQTVEVLLVTYQPDEVGLRSLFDSLVRERLHSKVGLRLLVWDNSTSDSARMCVDHWVAEVSKHFKVAVWRGGANVGFGRGHNALLEHAEADWLLILNQDVVLEPGVFRQLSVAASKASDVAVWELRQLPFEHPKMYNPSSLDTPWFSGAAFMVRRQVMLAVGGFDPRIFMYGEDVDLSWRIQALGWRTSYLPKAAVIHNTYSYAGEVKPLQILEGTLTNLCLRARFGTWRDVVNGLFLLTLEIFRPNSFPGRRLGLLRVFGSFWGRVHYFRQSGRSLRGRIKPYFNLWNFALHREGAFHRFRSAATASSDNFPLVSVIVRTHARPSMLREALQSIANQTYPNLEVVVVEDGAPIAQQMVEAEFSQGMNICYFATGQKVGRSEAGNRALASAKGEWLNFLDDDDQLFADHIEVLLDAAREAKKLGAYGLAWETETKVDSLDPYRYEEGGFITAYRQPFSRLKLWDHNYLPIQTVLFHRSLYERYGGFDVEMDQLEDWNLWTRYTLNDDFVLVEKTTSKYRVPHDSEIRGVRQLKLDEAYRNALLKQADMKVALTPLDVQKLIEEFVKEQTLICVPKSSVRQILKTRPFLRWLFKFRFVFRPLYRRVNRFLK